ASGSGSSSSHYSVSFPDYRVLSRTGLRPGWVWRAIGSWSGHPRDESATAGLKCTRFPMWRSDMTFLRANMKSSLVIVLALGCGILAVFWPQWRGELRAQGYYPGFGAGGKVTTAFENLAEARAVAIQVDGKIVV